MVASSVAPCAGLREQILDSTVGGAAGDLKPKSNRALGCTDHSHGSVRKVIRERKPDQHPGGHAVHGGKRGRLRQVPPGAQLIPDLDLAASGERRSACASSTNAPHANIQKDGTYRWCRMWAG